MTINIDAVNCVYIDSNILIYHLEGPPRLKSAARAFFQAALRNQKQLVVSEYVLAECLYGAHRNRDLRLATEYREMIHENAIDVYSVDQAVLEAAAALGPAAGLRLPDAIHVATALLADCDLFVTNDSRIRGQPGLQIALLD